MKAEVKEQESQHTSSELWTFLPDFTMIFPPTDTSLAAEKDDRDSNRLYPKDY